MGAGAACVRKVALTTVVWVTGFVVGAAAGGTRQTDTDALRAVARSNPTFNLSWVGDTPCRWPSVSCHRSRVTSLNFYNSSLIGSIPKELGSLTHLQILSLDFNQLSGSIPVELGRLISLQTLSLNSNQLSGSIPKEIGSLTSLQILSLDDNRLSGSIPVELGSLTSLQTLSLNYNQLNGSIPVELGNLTSLQTLTLESNQLNGSIPKELGSLTSLQTLRLGSNQLNGSMPMELGSLTSLQTLDLAINLLNGSIPKQLANLTSLQYLYLEDNRLNGSIPKELGSLTSLQFLDLSSNPLTGSIPKELGNLLSLQELRLQSNQLSGPIPKEFGSLTSLTQLLISYNPLNSSIPKELGNLTSLQTLWLQSNQLIGSIPKELGSLASLNYASLEFNQLTGSIPRELGNLTSLREISLDFNQLSGPIPKELGNLRSLQRLNLEFNQLNGSIPKELGSLTSLYDLQLSSNKLSGSIPKELGSLTSLRGLYLDSNQLSGPIPKELGSLTSLQSLTLDSNQLSGPIPKELNRLHITIKLGCIKHLTSKELSLVCTAALKDGSPRYDLSECKGMCLPPSPKTVAAYLWSAWLGIAVFIAICVLLVSEWCRPPAGEDPGDADVGITLIGVCKYAWGWLSLGFVLLDVITNFQTLRALVGSWSLYVVAFLIVWQHLVSGFMLHRQCVEYQSWPLGSGLCTKWAWDWRRCIIGSKGNTPIAVDRSCIHKDSILQLLWWPLGLAYVVLLDVLSLLSLKIGFQLKVGSEWLNLQPYWASRELTDALLQALPQAIFQTLLVVRHVDTRKSKITLTTSQFVLSVSSSLGSVIAVLAMALWEARMERRSVMAGLWDQFTGILPVARDVDDDCKSTSDSSKAVVL